METLFKQQFAQFSKMWEKKNLKKKKEKLSQPFIHLRSPIRIFFILSQSDCNFLHTIDVCFCEKSLREMEKRSKDGESEKKSITFFRYWKKNNFFFLSTCSISMQTIQIRKMNSGGIKNRINFDPKIGTIFQTLHFPSPNTWKQEFAFVNFFFS